MKKLWRLVKYRQLQCKRAEWRETRPQRLRAKAWAQQAKIREQDPLWRRQYDGKPNPWGLPSWLQHWVE